MRVAIVVVVAGLLVLCVASSTSAQGFALYLGDQELWPWNFPDPTVPFTLHLDLWNPQDPVQGFQTSIVFAGPLEFLGMTTYNDVENEGTYLPFGDRDGGELQLVFPDFGNCFQSQTGERLVSIELQFARTTDICSAIFFGPYSSLDAYFVDCNGTPLEPWRYTASYTLWCPDAVESSSFAQVKSLY